jgi:hypothetical protein
VNEIVALSRLPKKSSKAVQPIRDLSTLEAVDLNFRFAFHIALHRRLAYKLNPSVKSAFYGHESGHHPPITPNCTLCDRPFATRRRSVYGSRYGCEVAWCSGRGTTNAKLAPSHIGSANAAHN